MKELPKNFDFKSTDSKWIQKWKTDKAFHAKANSEREPYTIVIPPPNVTGILHMGHALNNTLQDITIRYKRMKGFEALWMPGTDHAGIATQNVVEKQLAKEGKTRHDIGRDAMLERLWAWKKEYGDTIIHQLESLGASCDWDRTRFTMDQGYSDAVKTVFISLYKKGLIYRGEYIINWCPRCHTALSDEEAEHSELEGALHYFRYSFKDNPKEFLTVATTRPETMLGDTAVAVNPNDERFKKYIGQTLILPLANREIKVIADEFVSVEFGTGAVKVTPAHDPNDFQMGQRHNLKFINILNEDATLNNNAPEEFRGLDRFAARKLVLKKLEDEGRLEKIDKHTHAVGHCYRCHTVVEPYLSKQWFVKMEPLAKPAITAVTSGKLKIHPERWSKVYMNWMENIRDWCISRQIWWGHRIPAWYCLDCAKHEPIVEEVDPTECPVCQSKNLKQEDDVLDTWFSSWLWPFATLGWPEKNEDVKYFYPTNSLFTASEIIFFWVARMVMAGYEFMGEIPFTDVYIHGTVRDEKGQKMSKSLGNALDPLEIIEEYGTDALRFSLIMNSGQDLYISKDKFEIGRNFANKIFNATRLIFMRVTNINPDIQLSDLNYDKLDTPSKWILSRFHTTLTRVEESIETFKFSEAESLIYEFFWNNFCDWYLEIIKDKWDSEEVQKTTIYILVNSLKMMHPFLPIVTEEIYSYLKDDGTSICRAVWPNVEKICIKPEEETKMQAIIDVITAIRNLRAEWKIKPSEKIICHFATDNTDSASILESSRSLFETLGGLSQIVIEENLSQSKNVATAVVGSIKCAIPLGDLIDIEKEKARMQNELDQQVKALGNLQGRLNNKNFVERAPEEIIQKERERLADLESRCQQLTKVIETLQ